FLAMASGVGSAVWPAAGSGVCSSLARWVTLWSLLCHTHTCDPSLMTSVSVRPSGTARWNLPSGAEDTLMVCGVRTMDGTLDPLGNSEPTDGSPRFVFVWTVPENEGGVAPTIL